MVRTRARMAFTGVELSPFCDPRKGEAGSWEQLWQIEEVKFMVIGAGISGLVCARKLVEGGHAVVVVEKSRSLGGRCASRKFGEHVVDSGAQYFTLRDEVVRRAVELVAGDQLKKLVAPIFEGEKIYRAGEERFYLAAGNNRLGKLLAEGLEVRKETEAKKVVAAGKKWEVAGELYDGVISSAPGQQSAALLGMKESGIAFEPNLTACLEYDCPWDGLRYATMGVPGEEALAWVGCENAKEGRVQSGKSVYVVQASAGYSLENLEKEPEVWLGDLAVRLEKSLGLKEGQRGLSFGHRWRYARRAQGSPPVPALAAGLFLCGDSVAGSRIESVWKNGFETAEKGAAMAQERGAGDGG